MFKLSDSYSIGFFSAFSIYRVDHPCIHLFHPIPRIIFTPLFLRISSSHLFFGFPLPFLPFIFPFSYVVLTVVVSSLLRSCSNYPDLFISILPIIQATSYICNHSSFDLFKSFHSTVSIYSSQLHPCFILPFYLLPNILIQTESQVLSLSYLKSLGNRLITRNITLPIYFSPFHPSTLNSSFRILYKIIAPFYNTVPKYSKLWILWFLHSHYTRLSLVFPFEKKAKKKSASAYLNSTSLNVANDVSSHFLQTCPPIRYYPQTVHAATPDTLRVIISSVSLQYMRVVYLGRFQARRRPCAIPAAACGPNNGPGSAADTIARTRSRN